MFALGSADDDLDEHQESYVGRLEERERIKSSIKLQKCHLVHITGDPMIGKAALAEQISLELAQEAADLDTDLTHYVLSCEEVCEWTDFVRRLCEICNITSGTEHPRNVEDLKAHFHRITNQNRSSYHLIVLTKCDNLLSRDEDVEKFILFCNDLAKKNLFMIVTSQKWLLFPPRGKIKVHREILSALLPADSVALLQTSTPDIDLHSCEEEIVRRCHGLPRLILLAGQLLASQGGMILPSDLCELMQSAEDVAELFSSRPAMCKPKAIMQNVISRLHLEEKKIIATLSVFHESFSDVAATNVLESACTSKTKLAFLPLREQSLLTFDSTTKRYRLFPFLKPAIFNEPGMLSLKCEAERRYIRFFGQLLVKTTGDMYLESIDRIYGYLHPDRDNVEHMIRKAIHVPDENIYKTYMEVVEGTEDLIVACFPRDAENFYSRLLDMANMFGTDRDKAVLKCHIACAMTGIQVGGKLTEAAGLYEEAMAVLQESATDKYQLLLLLQRLVRTYQKMGRNADGKRCIEYAKAIDFDSSLQLKADRVKLGITAEEIRLEVFHENYDKVASVVRKLIEEAQSLAPHHPSIGKLINCIGLMYDRSNRSKTEALKSYLLSIREKQKFIRQCPEMMVDSMNNAAMLICKEQGDTLTASEKLTEALQICMDRLGGMHYDTGLTLWNMGQVLIREHHFVMAQEKIELAKLAFTMSTPEHWANVEVRWTLAHCYMATNRYQDALRTFQEIRTFKDLYAKHMPQGDLVASATEHLLYLDNIDNWVNIYQQLVEELQRIQVENAKAEKEEKRVENKKREQQYHDLAEQYRCKHEKSRLIRPANPVLEICFMCERYRIQYYSPVVN